MASTKELELRIILKAHDKASAVVRDSVTKSQAALSKMRQTQDAHGRAIQSAGLSAIGMGAATAYSMTKPIEAFMEQEAASERLAASMLRDGNRMSEYYKGVNDLAIQLGNKLPGTAADLQNMMTVLIRNGVAGKDILDGMGEATANLAAVLEMGYAETAVFSSKLGKAAGVASKDMMQFMDIIARTANLGVKTEEMQYAFSKSSSALNRMGLTGLEASKSVSALYGSLIQAGASGETVGTGMTSMFGAMVNADKMKKFNDELAKVGVTAMSFTDAKGNFAGIENMIGQLDKLKQAGLSSTELTKIQEALLGPGQDANFLGQIIAGGSEGFNNMVQQMSGQATLQDKLGKILQTTASKWDAATGTFKNTLAAFAEKNAETIKSVIDTIGELSEALTGWMNKHPTLTKWIGITIASVSAFLLVSGGLAIGIGTTMRAIAMYGQAWQFLSTTVFPAVARAWTAMSTFLMANPWMAVIAGIVVVATLVYTYWDEIVAFVKKVWEPIAPYFEKLWYVVKTIFLAWFNVVKFWFLNFTPVGLIFKHWDKIVPYFKALWGYVAPIFKAAIDGLMGMYETLTRGWSQIVGFFEGVWGKVSDVFTKIVDVIKQEATRFYEAGKNIVLSIFKGIEEMAYKPVEAMDKLTKKMRSYLPFSPAKAGAFRDIHRVKIVETIAEAMRPDKAVKAMSRVAVGMATVAAPVLAPMASAANIAVPTANRTAVQGGSGVVVNYNPTINISGSGEQAKDDFAKLLREHKDELMRIFNKETERNRARSF